MGGELIVGVEKEVGTFTDEHGVTHKRYIKIVNCGALPNNSDKSVSISDIDFIEFLYISGASYGGNYPIPIPYTGLSGSSSDITVVDVFIDKQQKLIRIKTNSNFSSYNAYVTLEYYK